MVLALVFCLCSALHISSQAQTHIDQNLLHGLECLVEPQTMLPEEYAISNNYGKGSH